MNFLMAYLNAADRIENIVAGAERDHGPHGHHPLPKRQVSNTKICWILLILTVAIPMAIFIGILQFFPSLMDISQDILNERKANQAAKSDKVDVHPPWNYNSNPPSYSSMYPQSPSYPPARTNPPPPMYPPPPIVRDEYQPKAAFDYPSHEASTDKTPAGDYSSRGAFENLNAERSPYDRYHQSPRLNPNYRIFQSLGHEGYSSYASAVDEDSGEDLLHRSNVRSSEKLNIESEDAKKLLQSIDPNWYSKVTEFMKRPIHRQSS